MLGRRRCWCFAFRLAQTLNNRARFSPMACVAVFFFKAFEEQQLTHAVIAHKLCTG